MIVDAIVGGGRILFPTLALNKSAADDDVDDDGLITEGLMVGFEVATDNDDATDDDSEDGAGVVNRSAADVSVGLTEGLIVVTLLVLPS